uniref:Uncharacterized protein n=1 Tax=Avena sativa TaxID=4498 RepID=A0ACD5YTL0_AVESA
MEAGARGWEDHAATAPQLGSSTDDVEEKPSLAVKLEQSVEANSAVPQVGDGLSDYNPGASSTGEYEEKPNLAVKLEQPVEAISAPFEVKVQIGEQKSPRVDDEKSCNFLGESGCSNTCHVANGGLSSKAPDAPCDETFYSRDVVCVDTETGRSQSQWDGLAGNGGDMAEVMAIKGDLKTVSEEAHCDNEGLSDSAKNGTERWPRGVDGVIFRTDDNYELRQGDSVPKIETKLLREASVPSVSGRVDVSLSDKPDCVGEISGDPVTSHVADGATGEISEHKTDMEKVACGSLGGRVLSGEGGFWKDALGDENQFSRMEGCYANGGLGHQDLSGVELGCPDHLVLELNAYNSVVDKHCSTVFVENSNDDELENQKSESSVSRRRNPRRSASSRDPTLEKHDQTYKGSSSAHKPKKVESLCPLVESTMVKFPNKTTKVRSGINRPLKSTGWGSPQKLPGGFGQNCEPSTSNSHLISLENGRSRKRSRKKEQPSSRKTRSSRCSKNKSPPFSAIGFASDELNDQPAFSVTSDTYGSSEGYIGTFPRLAPHALVNGSDHAHKTAQCMSIQTDLPQLDRCLESVTQETCHAYIPGDFAKSTSEPSLNIAGVGFSPDSVLEVASAICENNTSASHDAKMCRNPSCPFALNENGLHASDLSTSDSGKNHASSSTDLEQWAQTVRGDENTRNEEIDLSHAISGYIGERKVRVLEKSNAVRKSKKVGKQERQKKDGMKGKNIKHRDSTKIPSKLEAFSDDSYSLVASVPPKSCCFEIVHEHDSMQGPYVIGKEQTNTLDKKSPRQKNNDDSGGKKDTLRDPYVKEKSINKNMAGGIFFDSGSSTSPSQLVTDPAASHTNEQNGASVPQPQRAAWVCCDDCQKWRCIPADLADSIGKTNCRWTCKDNHDKTFADCSISQEKTNAEINAELDLSDASADEADNDGSNSKASKAPSWTHVRTNSYLHRNRRNQSVDESMVCNCKPPQDGRMGCRDGCLNRMLNIECEKRTCPCGEQCSNQQFQRRSYAKISWFHSGKKGYGLQLQEEVSEGRFLIEYVGEVLDITAYESRQRYYASKGQKHFYFMALNGGEVIDACTKGNLGRFINHSCSPNCRTEKWMVNGEVCIGIFATRNMKKGEELTFDYNYVRVSGAAPQKCFCGTAKCRGYIGGDISGSDIIAQDGGEAEHFEPMVTYKDADEILGNAYCSDAQDDGKAEHFEPTVTYKDGEAEHFEPMVTCKDDEEMRGNAYCSNAQDDGKAEHLEPMLTYKDAEEMLGNAYCSHGTNPNIVEHETSIQREDSNNCPPASPDSEPHQQTLLTGTSEPENSMEAWSPQDAEDVTRTPVHVSRTIESSFQQFPVYDAQPLEFLEKTPNLIDGLTAPNVMNRSTPSSDLGSSLVLGFHAKEKNSLIHQSNVKPPCPIDNEHTLGVEGRLNSLLDRDGGISRRKDSTHEYLRLLLMTAADGDAGGTSKSIRDLALILEALLQTKSGAVLLDIVNMNGLQMLHNILKQNRDHFLRRPIIRKLLKVLEFLALRGILTAEKINEGPRCAGMESFRDSMLKLTRHSDKHVHPIARKFCDKWILPYMDRPANCSTHSYSARRKRKSRWDYQPESHYKMVGLQIGKVYSGHGELDLQTSLIRNRSQGNWVTNSNHNDAPVIGSSKDGPDDDVPPGFGPDDDVPPGFGADDDVPPGFGADDDVPPGFGADDDVPPGFGADDDAPPGFGADDDAPPGFEPPQERQPTQAPLDLEGAPGFCQGALFQHLGTPQVEGTQCGQKWKAAPAVPFNPYPRGSPCPSTSSTQMPRHDGPPAMKHNSSGYRGRGSDRGGRVHRNWPNGPRTRFPYDHQGRRFPSNHHRLERCEPQRPQEHDGSELRARE